MSLNRATFRNLWILVSLLLLGGAWFMFQEARQAAQEAKNAKFTVSQLLAEKDNQETLARQHNQLDDFTIDERNATRLDILRHLELQATGYDFRLEASQSVDAGGVSLFTRQFILKATLPYAQALALADRIHNNPKVVIQSYELTRVTSGDDVYGDAVKIKMVGTMYGLEKR